MILCKLISSHRLHTLGKHWMQPKRKPGASSIDANMGVDSSELRAQENKLKQRPPSQLKRSVLIFSPLFLSSVQVVRELDDPNSHWDLHVNV